MFFGWGSGNDTWSRLSLLDFAFGRIGRDEQPVVLLFPRPGGWLKTFLLAVCWFAFVFEEAVDVQAGRDNDEDGKLGFSFTVS